MKLSYITPVLAAGAAAVAIAAAPTALAEPAQLTNPSAAVASQIVPAGFHGGGGGFHGGGYGGGFHGGGDRGGFHGNHYGWGWNPWNVWDGGRRY
jgi:hypothetical protein